MPQTTSAPLSLVDGSSRWWDQVVYGPPGVGKTAFACTSALRTFVFNVDMGMNSAVPFRIRRGLPLTQDHINVWPVQTVADFEAGVRWLEANIRYYQDGLVVLDSGTELQRIIIREVTTKNSKITTPDQRDWGTIRMYMENHIVRFRYLPFHFLMTCHEVSKFDPDFNREVWRPSFDGRVAFEYAKHFSLIGRYSTMHVQGPPAADGKPTQQLARFINYGPNPYAHYKDRSTILGPYEAPDIDNILARVMASSNPATWQTQAAA